MSTKTHNRKTKARRDKRVRSEKRKTPNQEELSIGTDFTVEDLVSLLSTPSFIDVVAAHLSHEATFQVIKNDRLGCVVGRPVVSIQDDIVVVELGLSLIEFDSTGETTLLPACDRNADVRNAVAVYVAARFHDSIESNLSNLPKFQYEIQWHNK